MKRLTFFFSILLFIGCKTSTTNTKKNTVFHTNDAQLILKLNGQTISQNWTMDASLNPDIFEADCTAKENKVTFVDSRDSISFTITKGDTTDFVIITSSKDSAFTRIIGVQPNYNFTKAYIEKNQGKTNVEIPEVSELANILVALHPDVDKDTNMTDSSTDYYKRVQAHFQAYANHPIIDTIEKYIGDIRYIEDGKVALFSNESYRYYYALKMNACTYEFAENGELVNQGFIREMAKGWSPFDPFKDKALMEDFAKKSNFRAFYKENKPYYEGLLKTYNTLNPIADMQEWLDKKFGFTYGNYTIYFSPLVSGAHSTKNFDTKDFRQTFMFIARAEFDDTHSRTVNELLESRVVFTEIDHNYVDIVSQKYIDKINTIFSKREIWVDEELTDMYPNPSKVFNEYMTFGVYSLYVNDNYNKKDRDEFLPMMENKMENSRGFLKFKAFNQALLKKYQDTPTISMEELYAFILDWSETVE